MPVKVKVIEQRKNAIDKMKIVYFQIVQIYLKRRSLETFRYDFFPLFLFVILR